MSGPSRTATGIAALCLLVLCGCASTAEIRIENVSTQDFARVSIAGQPYGDIPAGATTDYRTVDLKLGYAAMKMWVSGLYVTGQALHMGARRFTYRIAVKDLEKRHLDIELVRE